ncbi:MAG TPA: DUF971 domain-containing protein [bacterium]|nr:DUF971 domain-containing protein [bacterium]
MSPKRMPTPAEVGSVTDKTLMIVWSDAHRSSYSWLSLRMHCPCARCKEGVGQIPQTIRAMSMGRVGAYALRFVWSDGHDTGIYPFPLLRFELCECGQHDRVL